MSSAKGSGRWSGAFDLLVAACALMAAVAPREALDAQTAGALERKRVQAARIQGAAPRIDGRLDDEVWKQAAFVSDFLEKEPQEGATPQERTEVAFAYDGHALYVGARMYNEGPDEVRALISRRDDEGTSEQISVSLDTYLDRRTASTFGVTAAGVRFDYFHPSDDQEDQDPSFDPVWEARARVEPAGWTAELKIPFSQLRFNDRDVQVWGVNVRRLIPARNEDVYWVYVPKEETGWASRFGDLVGIDGIKPSRRLELLPYVAGDGSFSGDHDPEDPFDKRGGDLGYRAGGDLKMGFGPNLTLDATVNPDFGQVEADPAVVNLTAFETSFDERRPFFTEGSELLSSPGQTYFYSRRVGASPHGEAPGSFVEEPNSSTILGAAKLTGRLNSGLSIGGLTALTARERARTFDEEDGSFGSAVVEPVTGFGVARLQQQFGPSASTAGVILTGVRRDVSSDAALAAILPRQAYAGGADWNLRFADGDYELTGNAGFSYVEGDPAAILELQLSSARYYQRPDADYVSLDPSRTSLEGYTGSLSFAKKGGRHWLWNTEGTVTSPGFEINDAGILNSADEIETHGELTYRETRPGKLFHSYDLTLSNRSLWDFGGVRLSTSPQAEANVTWANFWESDLKFGLDTRAQSHDLTRGGPLMGTWAGWTLSAGLSSSDASTTTWSVDGRYANDELGGWGYGVGGALSLRPGPRWEFSIEPGYDRSVDPRQFITSIEGGGSATFDNRYIFSFVEESELSAQIRMHYSYNPDLSIDLYAEPFVASGRFYRYGELEAAGSRFLRTYGTDGTTISRDADGSRTVTDGEETFTLDNEDFDVGSFRSNLVLRWEWRPGSTLFLIWQQDRSSFEPHGDLVGPASLLDPLKESGDHVLAVKLAYWIPID